MQDALQGTLAAAMFALRATHHATPQSTPSQLAFGRDAIMNVQTLVDWTAIKAQKQHRIQKNNEKENEKRIPCVHRARDKTLLKNETKSKFGESPCEGPCEIAQVNAHNGAVRHQKGVTNDAINVRQMTPHHEWCLKHKNFVKNKENMIKRIL